MDSNFTHLFKLSEKISLEFIILTRKSIISDILVTIRKVLQGIFREADLKRFMLAIDEVLQNTYEHGNLELSKQEKKDLLENDLLDQELKEREHKFSDRTITIKIQIIDNILHFKVSDQGKGFDWKKLRLHTNEQTALSGRGISIIQAATDSVKFNKVGNSITLLKRVGE